MWKGEWKAYALWLGWPLIGLVLAAVAVRIVASKHQQRNASPGVYQHDLFTLTLPKGWRVVRERERATEKLGNYIEDEAGGEARFRDDRGNFFEVLIPCPATEAEGDAMWHCEFDEANGRVSRCREEPTCTRQQQEECLKDPNNEVGCLCTAGDSTLHIWAVAGAGEKCFIFGNTNTETGVDLAPFREMLGSFRAR